MYKSSSNTFFYKYLFTPILVVGILFMIIRNWTRSDQFLHDWSINTSFILVWALIWLTIPMIRLRRVVATQENLIIKSIRRSKIVDYKDIEWISQIAMITPTLISLKYYDKGKDKSKKILIMPSTGNQMLRLKFLEEFEMTKYIRDRIIDFNPNYNKELEPSRWSPFVFILLSMIPLIIYSIFIYRIL